MDVKVKLSQIQRSIFIALLCIGFFIAGYLVSDRHILNVSQNNGKVNITISRDAPKDKQNLNFSLFWQVWDELYAKYYDKNKLDPEKLVYGAIKGMVEAAGDPYTVFLPPTEQKRIEEDLGGSFEGVGIQIGFKGTQLAVMAPLKNSPAEKSGVKAGDYIVGIKDKNKNIDKNTAGMSLPEAVEDIRGPQGSKVTLTLLRAGVDKPFDVDLTREKIDVPSVMVSYEDNGKVAHLKLLTFGAETEREWDKAVNEIASKRTVKYLVFDLRNNTGGFLTGAVYIGSEFIKDGIIVMSEDANGQRTNMNVDRTGKLTDIPMVVLVNKGSASASEIVAGALRDHNRAKLVGETTFGKGTIQGTEDLPGGAGLHITTAKWLTPNGTWVHEKGLDPDVSVVDDPNTPQDEQLQKGIEVVVQ